MIRQVFLTGMRSSRRNIKRVPVCVWFAACAFWMIFGGNQVPEQNQNDPDPGNFTMTVEGMQNPNALLFTLFRLTLVDDYDYDVSA